MTRKQKRLAAQAQNNTAKPLPIIFQVSTQIINPEDVLSCMTTKELKDLVTMIFSLPSENDKLLQALTDLRAYVQKADEAGDIYDGFDETVTDCEQELAEIDTRLGLGLAADSCCIHGDRTLISMSILHNFLGCVLGNNCFEHDLLDPIDHWIHYMKDKLK